MEKIQQCLTNTLYGINLTSVRDWNVLDDAQWQHLRTSYTHCSTLSKIIAKLHAIRQENRMLHKTDLVKLYQSSSRKTLAWLVDKHTDDYWATIPKDIVNIIREMLCDVKIGTRVYHGQKSLFRDTNVFYYKTYFCGFLHSFNNQPAVVKIGQNAKCQIALRWMRYGKYYYPKSELPNIFIYDGLQNSMIWQHINKCCSNCSRNKRKSSYCQIRTHAKIPTVIGNDLRKYNHCIDIIDKIVYQQYAHELCEKQHIPIEMPDWR